MNKKKIKIFLGGYVNFPNAQNINCDNIAKYLDKEKFEVHTMYTSKKSVDKEYYKKLDIKLHRLIHHRFIWYWSKWLTMLFGNYDIYYLPKVEKQDHSFAMKFKGNKKVFIASLEGVVTESTNNSEEYKDYFLKVMDSSFAISNCIAESVKKFWHVDMPVLPLGTVEIDEEGVKNHKEIKNIIWVGNVKSNKRPQLLLQCAEHFPNIEFTMIGDGDMLEEIQQKVKENKIPNVKLTGRIPNSEVYEYMKKNDLLLMTSEYEGLPKVIQEAAQCGLPSVYIAENYSVDFIKDFVNGFAVYDVSQMIEKVQFLLDNPEKYSKMSQNVYQEIQQYTWKNIIKQYENYFIKQYEIYCSRKENNGF